MKTLADLRAQTRMFLDEATQSDWTDAEVDREINVGYHKIVTAVTETFEDFYITIDTLTTQTNKQEYGVADGLPDDIFRIRRVETNFSPSVANSSYSKAQPIRFDDVTRDMGSTTGSLSPFRRIAYYVYGFGDGMKMGFIPIPQDGGVDAVKIWYVPIVDDLVLSTDEINIPYPDAYYHIASMFAAANLLSKGQQEEVAAKQLLIRATAGEMQMRQQLEDRVADEANKTTNTSDEDVDFGNYGII